MAIFRKKRMNKRGAISLVLASVCAFAACSLTACFGGGGFNADADMDAVNNAASTMLETPTDGTTPLDHDAKENAFYAAYAMNEVASFVGRSEGETITKVAVANVSQKIKSHRVVTQEETYKESLSHSSFKGVGMRTFVNGDNYVMHETKRVGSIDDAEWEEEARKVSKDTFIETFGYVPNGITSYIMTEESIISAEYLGEENGLYAYRYELDPATAATKLLLEMRTMAGTKSLPIFERAAVTFRMDENWRVAETTTDCVYQVDMLGGVTCTEDVTEYFTIYEDEIAEIPNGDFYRSYMNADVSDALPEDATALDYLMNGFADYITGTKPLKVELGVAMAGETPLSVQAQAEIDLNLDDLSKLGVKANIQELAFGEAKLNDLFIGYKNEVAYVSLGDFKAKGEVNEIVSIVSKLLSYFGVDLSQLGGSFASLDVTSLLANATLEKGETQSVVNLPLNLGDLTINAQLVFNEGEQLSLAGATASIGDVHITLTPNDNLTLPQIGSGYRILTPVFDVIDEKGDIQLDVALGDVNALVNLHLADLSADVCLGDLTAKYANEVVYLNYKDLKVKLGLSEIQPIIDKLMPILEGKVELPDLESLAETIDVMSLLTGAVNGLTLVEENDVLTISTAIDGIAVAIKLNITNNGYTYSFGGIEIKMDDVNVAVNPTEETFNAIANDDLHNYNNIATLLDIIDENNEINLQATVDTLTIDLNVNLETFTVLAKADLYGNTLFLKYYEEMIYVSYLDLNVSVNVNDFESVMNKLKPILGDSLDLSSFGEFDIQTLIDSITVTDDEFLTVSAEIFGIKADIVFDTTEGNLTIKEIKAAMGELELSVVPTAKADYSAMPNATYYNLVSLLDIIDENNEINLQATVDTLTIDLNVNLETFTILAKADLYGNTLFLKYYEEMIYVSYLDLNVSVDVNDFESVMNKLKPILGDSLDLSSFGEFDIQTLIDSITVTDGEFLTVSAEIFGIKADIVFDKANDDLSIAEIKATVEELAISVVPTAKADYSAMPIATYYNLVSLLDIIDENNEINLQATVDTLTINLNVNLETFTVLAKADLYGNTLFLKYYEEMIYVSYLDLNVSVDVNDFESVMNKLKPILGDSLDLSSFGEFDVQSLIDSITVTDGEFLTISAEIFGIKADIVFGKANDDLSIAEIKATVEELAISVVPTAKADYSAMPNGTYYNLVSLLDIIDENNEINLQATVDTLTIDLNVNLETFTVLAKADLYGNTLFLKYYEEMIYVSYLDLNVSVDVNDFESVMNKLKPILGDSLDLSSFGEFDIQALIDSITVTDDEFLTVSAEIFGIKADIVFGKANDDLSIAEIKATVEELAISVVPTAKADYSAMPNATYYNLVSLLDIIDEDNNISLFLYVDRTEIYATLNLEKMVLLAKLDDLEAYVDLNSGDVYVRYPGAKAKANFNDLSGMLDVIKPIIDKFVGEDALGGLDLDSMSSIDVEELLSTVTVKETNGKLTISLELSGVQIALNLSTENGDLAFESATASMDEMEISVTEAESALNFEFDLGEDYIDLKDLVDTFGETLYDVLTADSLAVTLSASLVAGNTSYNIVEANVQLADINTAPRANVNLTLEIATTADDGTITTSTHVLRFVYLDPSLVAEGATNAYVTYDNKIDTNIFEATFVTSKFDTTLEILKQIYVNMPELQGALKPFIYPDENGQPVLPDTNIDFISMINYITYANSTLTGSLNGKAFMQSLPENMIANISCIDGVIGLNVPTLSMSDTLTICLDGSVRLPQEGEITDSTFAYTASSNASNFSSINELMQALETTSRQRAFKISGSVDLKIGSYTFKADDNKSPIDITAQLEVVDEKTYASIYIKRTHLEALLGLVKAWEDYDGWAWLYFDPDTNLIYVHDVSRTEKKEWSWSKFGYIYSYPETHTYTKYTPEEFTSDIMGNILSIIHLSSTFENMITDAVNGESKANNPTIENTFLKYAYNGTDKFTVNLDLAPLTKDIHNLDLDIFHDKDMAINALNVKMNVVGIIDIVLGANLTTGEAGSLGLESELNTQRQNGSYKSPTA